MTPIVAFAHCVCGIKLPLLSSQLPASNTTWLLCGDLPPPIPPLFLRLSLSLCRSPSHLNCLPPSHSLLLDSVARVFKKRRVGKEVKGWNDTSSQRKEQRGGNERTNMAHKHDSFFMIAFQCLSHFWAATRANIQALMFNWGIAETKQKERM